MRTVAVTGVSGYLGRKVAERLAEEPGVARVVGIDIVEPDFATGNLEFYKLDIRSSDVAGVLAGCDAVVHLAATASKDADATRDVNVTGTRVVVDAAGRAGVGVLVYVSTHRVYGNHADNDYPLTESSPVRPAPTDAYAASKAEAERIVAYFADNNADVAVAILRLAWVGGPSLPANPTIESPVRLVLRGYDPASQAVHEDDAARAIVHALTAGLRGTYNVCADDTVDNREQIYGQRVVSIDPARAERMLDATSRVGLTVPGADAAMLMYPQVMTSAKLAGTGFTFEHSSQDAMRAAAEARREWLAVGRVRFRPRRAAMVVGTLGAVFIGSAVRSLWRRPRDRS